MVLFGAAGLFGKWISWDAPAIVLGRTLVAAACLGGLFVLRGRRLPPPTVALVLNGVVLAVHWIAFFAAIQVSSVALGLLGFASFPLFVPLFERVLHGTRHSGPQWLGATIVAAGLVLVVPELRWRDGTGPGLAWGILSGSTFALLAVRARGLVATHSPAAIALWQNAAAAGVTLPLVVALGGVGTPTVHDLALVLVLGVVFTALAHTLFTASLARLSAHTAAVCAALEPVYGIAFAWLLLGEAPGARIAAGVAVLILAAVVASWQAHPAARRPERDRDGAV